MKAVICTEHDVNIQKWPPESRGKMKPVFRRGADGKQHVNWRVPEGVEVDGERAVKLVRYGLARPLDKECADAAGLTEEELRVAIEDQEMAQLGIHSKNDQELYRAGVIKGFKPKAGGGVEYDWGPNAEAYKAALGAVQEEDEEDDGELIPASSAVPAPAPQLSSPPSATVETGK